MFALAGFYHRTNPTFEKGLITPLKMKNKVANTKVVCLMCYVNVRRVENVCRDDLSCNLNDQKSVSIWNMNCVLKRGRTTQK